MTDIVLSVVAGVAVLALVLQPYIGGPGGMKASLKLLAGGVVIAAAMVLIARVVG